MCLLLRLALFCDARFQYAAHTHNGECYQHQHNALSFIVHVLNDLQSIK